MGDRLRARRGRPWKPVCAESEQARELAEFLRAQISASGMTLAEVGRSIHRSKAQISHYVSGVIPPAELVDDLIRTAVAEPRLQQLRLAEGRRLLQAACRPSFSIPMPSSVRGAGHATPSVPGVHGRLVDTLERLAELERERSDDRMLIMVLLGMLARTQHPVGCQQTQASPPPSPALGDSWSNPAEWWVRQAPRHHTRAMRSLLGQAGIRQFLDIGTGLPTADNTSRQVTAPSSVACRFVYATHACGVHTDSEALLPDTPADLIDYIDADVHDPETIIWGAARTLDFSLPIAITMLDVGPLLRDTAEAVVLIDRLLQVMPSGSYLVISRPAADVDDGTTAAGVPVDDGTGRDAAPTTLRGRDDLMQLLDRVSALEAGGVAYSRWNPSAA